MAVILKNLEEANNNNIVKNFIINDHYKIISFIFYEDKK